MPDSGVATLEDDRLLDEAHRLEQEGTTTLVGGVITLFAGVAVDYFGERDWPGRL